MTADQQKICIALGSVRYLSGSWDKRFGNNLHGIAVSNPEQPLSDSQNEWMFRLLYKYRKQLQRIYIKFEGHQFCNKKPKR
jgi:hypothetical protein